MADPAVPRDARNELVKPMPDKNIRPNNRPKMKLKRGRRLGNGQALPDTQGDEHAEDPGKAAEFDAARRIKVGKEPSHRRQ